MSAQPAGRPLRRMPTGLALTLLLAGLSALGPLSTDMYLPSLPSLRAALGAGMDEVQLTLSLFVVGFALSQLVWGPLADRIGRRPVLFAGLLVFSLGSAICALAPNIWVLVAARFLQAVGASVGIVVAPAIVRDLQTEGAGARERSARLLAQVSTARALAPAVAPILGGYLQALLGWQSTFVILTFFGLTAVAVVLGFMGETLAKPNLDATSPGRILANARVIVAHAGWRASALAAAFCYCGLFAYISGSSFVLIGILGLSPMAFGFCFAVGVFGYMAGTYLGSRLTMRLGTVRMVRLGGAIAFGAGLAMLVAVLAGVGGVYGLIVPLVFYMIGSGLILPNAMAGAVSPFPTMAATASALSGVLQMGLASLLGLGIAMAFDGTALPMTCAITLSGALVFAASRLQKVERKTAP